MLEFSHAAVLMTLCRRGLLSWRLGFRLSLALFLVSKCRLRGASHRGVGRIIPTHHHSKALQSGLLEPCNACWPALAYLLSQGTYTNTSSQVTTCKKLEARKTRPGPKNRIQKRMRTLLGGSWVVITGAISPLIWVIITVPLLITPLPTHEPPSKTYQKIQGS